VSISSNHSCTRGSACARCSAPAWALGFLATLLLGGCGREDIELARRASPANAGGSADSPDTPAADDCSTAVPVGLLAPRPPMGWNGYNAFECAVAFNETKVKASADALISSGMQTAGYEYVNLDMCWETDRSSTGSRVEDPGRLPGGMKALANYVHAAGLKLGVFGTTQDCLQTPGGEGHEDVDAQTYAEWGIDYLKYTQCGMSNAASASNFQKMASALANVGRPIVLSIVDPPFAEWMPNTGQSWRTSMTVTGPTWDWLTSTIDLTTFQAPYARPGAFNDADMLEVGNETLSINEQRLHFTIWSILSAPLLAGNDLTQMSDATRAILTNAEVIALDQDPLGLEGALVRSEGQVDILAKPLAECGGRGVVMWNRGANPSQVTLAWNDIWLAAGPASVRDLWAHADLGPASNGVTVTVQPHDVVALKVVGNELSLPHGNVYLSDLRWSYVASTHSPIELDVSNGEPVPGDGKPMRLRGRAYKKGLGAHSPSLVRYRLGKVCSRFLADVGIDDETDGRGSAEFEVWADGEKLFASGALTGTSPPKQVDVDLRGRRELRLFVGEGQDNLFFDHADWADARLECAGAPVITR
jgi:alpha-galactosidase